MKQEITTINKCHSLIVQVLVWGIFRRESVESVREVGLYDVVKHLHVHLVLVVQTFHLVLVQAGVVVFRRGGRRLLASLMNFSQRLFL